MSIEVKICGLDRPVSVDAAVEGGARYTGFVFYPPSPRNLAPARAAELTRRVPAGIVKVGLFVDPTDAAIDAVLALNALDMLQLHGAESPERVAEIKRRTGLPAMKAIKIAGPEDVAQAALYADVAARILFDAQAPETMANALPGGNALAFDWTVLADAQFPFPWMLAGGITVDNVAAAVAISHATAVDVSSGVEDAPGVKNPDKIRAFLAAAMAL